MTQIQPRVPTPSGYEYFYWQDELGVGTKSDLLSIEEETLATEELFPTLYHESMEFVGWYYYTDNRETNKKYIVIGESFMQNSYTNEFFAEWKQCVSKVTYMGDTLIDLTNDTVTSEALLEGAIAHTRSGAKIIGRLVQYAPCTHIAASEVEY